MTKRSGDESYEWDGGNGEVGQKKQRQDGDRLRLLVLGRYAGPLIGKGGENFKRLREQYPDVKITGLNGRSNERVLQLTGPRADSQAIVNEILPQCPDGRYSSSNSPSAFELNVLAHTNCVGAVIGKKGSRMKEITEETGIRLKVYQECLPGSNERVVAIGGPDVETVIKGLDTVLGIIDTVPGPHHTTFWNPENAAANSMDLSKPSGPGNNINVPSNMNFSSSIGNERMNMGPTLNIMQGGLGAGAAPEAEEKNVAAILVQQRDQRIKSGIDLSKDFGSVETVTTLLLPNELCGVVIGKGGTNIKYIKEVSGAQIETAPGDAGGFDKRNVTLTGTQDQIQIAEQLMAQCLRAANQQQQPDHVHQQQQQLQQQIQRLQELQQQLQQQQQQLQPQQLSQQQMGHQQFLNQLAESRNSQGAQPLPLNMPWSKPQQNKFRIR